MGSAFFVTTLATPLAAMHIHRGGARAFLVVGIVHSLPPSLYSAGLLVNAFGNIGFGMVSILEGRGPFLATSLILRAITSVGDSMTNPACYPLAASLVR